MTFSMFKCVQAVVKNIRVFLQCHTDISQDPADDADGVCRTMAFCLSIVLIFGSQIRLKRLAKLSSQPAPQASTSTSTRSNPPPPRPISKPSPRPTYEQPTPSPSKKKPPAVVQTSGKTVCSVVS